MSMSLANMTLVSDASTAQSEAVSLLMSGVKSTRSASSAAKFSCSTASSKPNRTPASATSASVRCFCRRTKSSRVSVGGDEPSPSPVAHSTILHLLDPLRTKTNCHLCIKSYSS